MRIDITFRYSTGYEPNIDVAIQNMNDIAGINKAIKALQTMRSIAEVCRPKSKGKSDDKQTASKP